MNVRKANLSDEKFISKLNIDCFGEKNRDWNKLISGPETEMYVYEDERTVVGFTGVRFEDWNNSTWIINIFVHPDFRRKGIGSSLLDYLIAKVKETKYRTIMAEAPSKSSVIDLYEKVGFRKCGYNDRYYTNEGKEKAIFYSFDLY